MIYGYARVSLPTQNIERQIRNIKEFNSKAIIYQEAYTGTKIERPEWQKLLRRVRAGDTIIFDSVSRMSRNAKLGFEIYEELFNKEINLIFLKERHIDTDIYKKAKTEQIKTVGNEIADTYIEATNKVLMILARQQIQIAFDQAEKEVEDLHKRVSEGMKTAKLNGKQIGRAVGAHIISKKSIRAKEIILRHSIDFGGTLVDKDVIKLLGDVSRNTYYKYKKELKSELAEFS